MKIVESFSVANLPKFYPFGSYNRQVVFEGKKSNYIINGEEIEAQYLMGSQFLVVTHYDYFDGVSYWFYLFNQNGKMIDCVSTPDYDGFIQWSNTSLPSEAEFGFFGTNDKWTISVDEAGFRSFNPNQLLRRLNRFFFSRRYLTLVCKKGHSWTLEHEETKKININKLPNLRVKCDKCSGLM